MPRPRFHKIEASARENIIAVASRELARAGYEGASLNRIIVEAGLSKGVFYYYFDDKADLAATVFEHALEDAVGSLERFEPPAGAFDFWTHVEALARAGAADLQRAADKGELVSRLGAAMLRDPTLAARVKPFMKKALRVTTRFWRRGQELGAVRDDLPPELLSELVRRMKEALASALLPAQRAATAAELDRFLAIHLDLVRRIVAPGGKP